MKKAITVLLSAMILFGISSCQKTKDEIDELTEFDINYSSEFNIPASSISPTITTPLDITTPDIPTNSSSTFSSQKTAQDLVSEIKLTKFNISTSGDNLDFLKSVSFYIKTDSQGDLLIAKKVNTTPGVKSFSADIENVNIKEYIFKDKIRIKASFLFQTGSSNSQNLKMDQTVHVKATLLK